MQNYSAHENWAIFEHFFDKISIFWKKAGHNLIFAKILRKKATFEL